MTLPVLLSIALLFCGSAALAENAAATPAVQFNRDVRPILSENCFACHGPDKEQRKADLRLDTHEGLLAKIDDATHVIVPGRTDQSELYRRITADDPGDLMPPRKSGKKLTAAQKQVLKRWIEQGAPWQGHWSFLPPVRPALPEVKPAEWARNPIDRFVLAKLREAGLNPAPEADRRTLIRRLSFDLVGLPPTPREVEAFVYDNRADAYERLVDRLMASPHYGEHRGRYWLDAARYGDTHGIHNDNYREMWPYRDWVINAFNANMPFDQFTVEQLAGDLLPDRTLEQQIASGFHRCNITTSEGGSINEEVLVFYARERAETTATVFLGLTAGCAVCHDHKFDPITQKEFYQLTAFFRNTTQPAMDGNIPDTPPVIPVPRPEDRGRWTTLEHQSGELKQQKKTRRDATAKAFEAWVKSPEIANLAFAVDPAEQLVHLPLDAGEGPAIGVVEGLRQEKQLGNAVSWGDGPAGSRAIRFGASGSVELAMGSDLDPDQPFSISTWVYAPAEEGSFVIASKVDPSGKTKQGWSLEIATRMPVFRWTGAGKSALKLVGENAVRLDAGKWNHLVITYDGSRRLDGLAMYLDGNPRPGDQRNPATLEGSTLNHAPLRLASDGKRDLKNGGLADFRIYRRKLSGEEVRLLSRWNALRPKLASAASLKGAERDDLQLLYLNRFDMPYRRVAADLESVEKEQAAIRRRSPVTHVMQDKPGAKAVARVLFRGQYDQPREEVEAGTPAVLHPFPADAPRNRLGLAQWMVRPENPLTARVTVNRFWQEFFGEGLVRTTGDFGATGEAPSHPELLDWLAVEFRESGWDVKKLIRLMVCSAAYRQSAQITPEALARDPGNRLISRGPRYRLDAEMLRDSALASSGLLVPAIGGPSVKPYQPTGVWEAVAMFGSNTRFYKQDTGQKLYRRSMYTFWKRSAPPPSMEIFNAPSREVCTVRRERTDTPLQALVTMNDPQWVEAARTLAQHAIQQSGDEFDQRLDYVTRRVIARTFEPREREICRRTLDRLLSKYSADEASAKKLIATGESRADEKIPPSELAAWTLVVNQVMNLDEALNK